MSDAKIKSAKPKVDPETSALISKDFEKKPALAVYAAILLFDFLFTLVYFIGQSKDLSKFFKSLPVFGFSLVTEFSLMATLLITFLAARYYSTSAPMQRLKDLMLMITMGVASAEAILYIAFFRNRFAYCGFLPRHSAFLAILEVLGIAAVLLTLTFGANSPKVLLFSIVLCPLSCLLRLIPSFVFVRDFMMAKIELLDMTKADFLTPFFKSLNDSLFHLHLIKIIVCLIVATFAGAVYYHFKGCKPKADPDATLEELTVESN